MRALSLSLIFVPGYRRCADPSESVATTPELQQPSRTGTRPGGRNPLAGVSLPAVVQLPSGVAVSWLSWPRIHHAVPLSVPSELAAVQVTPQVSSTL